MTPAFASEASQQRLNFGSSLKFDDRSASPVFRSTLPKVLNTRSKLRRAGTDDRESADGEDDQSLERATYSDTSSQNAQPDDTLVHFNRAGQVSNSKKLKSSTVKISKYLRQQKRLN